MPPPRIKMNIFAHIYHFRVSYNISKPASFLLARLGVKSDPTNKRVTVTFTHSSKYFDKIKYLGWVS